MEVPLHSWGPFACASLKLSLSVAAILVSCGAIGFPFAAAVLPSNITARAVLLSPMFGIALIGLVCGLASLAGLPVKWSVWALPLLVIGAWLYWRHSDSATRTTWAGGARQDGPHIVMLVMMVVLLASVLL